MLDTEQSSISLMRIPTAIYTSLKEVASLRGETLRDCLRRILDEDKAAYYQSQPTQPRMSLEECQHIIEAQGWIPHIQSHQGHTYLYARRLQDKHAGRKPLKRYICNVANAWTLSQDEIIAKLYEPII